MRISIGVQQCKYCRPAMSAWTQKLELITLPASTLTMLKSNCKEMVRLPRVTCANTLGILGQGCTFHKVYNLR
jgi:hypothetical protein